MIITMNIMLHHYICQINLSHQEYKWINEWCIIYLITLNITENIYLFLCHAPYLNHKHKVRVVNSHDPFKPIVWFLLFRNGEKGVLFCRHVTHSAPPKFTPCCPARSGVGLTWWMRTGEAAVAGDASDGCNYLCLSLPGSAALWRAEGWGHRSGMCPSPPPQPQPQPP